MSSTLERMGRGTGVAGGILAITLWLLFLSQVVFGEGGEGNPWVAGLMLALAMGATVGGWLGRPVVLLISFALSFVPVGLYLLGTPSVYSGIGLANLLYVAGAVLILLGRRTAGPAS